MTIHPSTSSGSSRNLHPVRARYEALVKDGAIERDGAQEELVGHLDRLLDELSRQQSPNGRPNGPFGGAFGGPLGRLFGRKDKPREAPRGLYVWGSVGRGKTMLMDLFFETVPVEKRRRAHFHAFMADVHERIFAFRQRVKRGEVKDTDPIPHVAAALASEATLLCFDEFTVTDIADAMILGRLFSALFAAGVTVVATSNVVPSRLYENGLNRALFVPFIGLIEERMEVVELASRTDFRLEKLGGAPVYHVPADARAHAALGEAFRRLSGSEHGRPMTLSIKGHAVEVPEAAGGVARFGFADLCAKAYGASDYLAIAEDFHTVIVDDIPVLDIDRRNEAKRFITFIDALYDSHVKLLASAAAEPTGLYVATSGREAFEFERTASRLIEMRSDAYLALPHGRVDSSAERPTAGIAET